MPDSAPDAERSLSQKSRDLFGSRSGIARIPPFGIAVLSLLYFLGGAVVIVQGLLAGDILSNLVALIVSPISLVVAYGLWRVRFWAGTFVAVVHMLAVPLSVVESGYVAIVTFVASVIVVAYVWHVPDDRWT